MARLQSYYSSSEAQIICRPWGPQAEEMDAVSRSVSWMNTYTIQYMSCGHIWIPIFGTLQIEPVPLRALQYWLQGGQLQLAGMENLSSPGNPYMALIETVRLVRLVCRSYIASVQSLGTGYRQVISTLANSTTQSNCICRVKQVMLRSQHPSLCVSGFLWLHRVDVHQQQGCIRFTPGVCHLCQFPPYGIQVAFSKSGLPCNQCTVNGSD